MICKSCAQSIPISNASYCPFCGVCIVKRSVHQRGNGQGTAVRCGSKWQARVIVGWKTDGEKKRPVLRTKSGFATRKAALDYIPTLRGERRIKANLDHYWRIYSQDALLRLSSSKQTAYRIAYNKLGHIVYNDISTITVDELKRAVSQSCPTYYTARDAKQVLHRLYELADADGIGNPRLPDYIVLPTLQQKQGEPFTAEEIAKIWSAYESGTADAGYILIMIYTGMMPGEMCAMLKTSIDLQARQIIGAGLKTKARKSTPISIAEIIVPVIVDLQARSNRKTFIPCSRDDFYARYHAALKQAQVRDLPPYSCRHTTATALAVGQGVAPEIIRRVMRWSTTKMLSRYAHPDMQDAINAVNKIGKK